MMLSKNQIKWVKSLELKKNRRKEGCFVAEGPKVVTDLLRAGFIPLAIFTTTPAPLPTTPAPLPSRPAPLPSCQKSPYGECCASPPSASPSPSSASPSPSPAITPALITEEELRRLSFLQHPQEILAVFEIPKEATTPLAPDTLSLALDGIQDPGNLGTIIRLADWFGIKDIYCSHETVDAYNPKVVQATMGSLAHVRIHYVDLKELLKDATCPIYGTLLDGEDIYQKNLTKNGVIVMGNEGNGISSEIRKLVTDKLLIPNFSTSSEKAESLNVAIATAITCSEFLRR